MSEPGLLRQAELTGLRWELRPCRLPQVSSSAGLCHRHSASTETPKRTGAWLRAPELPAERCLPRRFPGQAGVSQHQGPVSDRSETLAFSRNLRAVGLGTCSGQTEAGKICCLRSNKWQRACKSGDGSLPVMMGLLAFAEKEGDCGCQPGFRHWVREHMEKLRPAGFRRRELWREDRACPSPAAVRTLSETR